MSEKRNCEGCRQEYWWPAARWQHEKCVNEHLTDASNRASNEVNDASNEKARVQSEKAWFGDEALGIAKTGAGGRDGLLAVSGKASDLATARIANQDGTTGKKQRWNRESYNAYQREYMRRVRANAVRS